MAQPNVQEKNRPTTVNILGVTYSIEYVDNPSNVDIFKRDSLWGQIDFWTRTIRVYDDGKRGTTDIWATVLHEVLHGIGAALHIDFLSGKNADEDIVDMLSTTLIDTFVRNGWLDLTE